MARDKDHWVRRGLAANRNLTDAIQQALAQDDDAEVLLNLARDNTALSRSFFAYHPNLEPEIRQLLSLDDVVWH